MKYYGTLGPACADENILKEMFMAGMTGLRLNTSHGLIEENLDWILMADRAAKSAGVAWELLIDLKGPEVRIGKISGSILLIDGEIVELSTEPAGVKEIPVPASIFSVLMPGQTILLDDGKIELMVLGVDTAKERLAARVIRGGELISSKSLAIKGIEIPSPTLTETDLHNLSFAASMQGLKGMGIRLWAVMQPFVRNPQDLLNVRESLNARGLIDVIIMAKIENESGVSNLENLMPYCDEVVIARGDLGNAVGLTKLPVMQRKIERMCKIFHKPYMVVTQMLNSMMTSPVPTRAEVSDIAHAVFEGASSVMLTGETAAGSYPVRAMQYLVETGENARLASM